MSIFEIASRKKLRFQGPKGPLTTEQLWDLPLNSGDGLSLDALAVETNRKLRELDAEESFVAPVSRKGLDDLALKLDILKYIISVKLSEAAATRKSQADAKQRDLLISILAEKENEELKKMSPAELRRQIEELS